MAPVSLSATRCLVGFLYVSGITSSGGSSTFGGRQAPSYRLPRWRDVLPYRLRWTERQGLFKFG